MRSKVLFSFAALVATASIARAGGDTPSSLLLFPEFDSQPGVYTMISVTNTKNGPVTPANSPVVQAHFVYINGTDCLENNRNENLTANDIVTVVAGSHNFSSQKGYLYVYAQDPATGKAIKWDWLVGAQMQLSGIDGFNYSYNPIGFKAAVAGNDGAFTDVDNDNVRDLNGVEYEKTWNEILVPHFFGQTTTRKSELVLINLTGGANFTATAFFSIYDDAENMYSTQYSWNCWVKVPLSKTPGIGDPVRGISNVFNNDFLSPSAPFFGTGTGAIVGASTVETGWMRIRGQSASSLNGGNSYSNPAIIAVLDETVNGTFGMSDLPYMIDQTNKKGDLTNLPGPLGDIVPGTDYQ